ncbi:MAG: OmpA family protein [Cyclobacteriaceae bacterium]
MYFSSFCFFLFSLLALPGLSSGQNLVPNGSFEEYLVCPGSYSEHPWEFRLAGWRSLTSGTPDYFNTCSEGEAAVPYNWAGVSDAFDGHGYTGIFTWMKLKKNYREYLHCKLTEPLIKDSLYHIEFRYKLSSYSKFSIDRIGLLLSDSLKKMSHDRPIDLPPTFSFEKDSSLTLETGSWELAVAEYRAKGHEQFLTIGNFADNQTTHYYHIQFRPESQPMLVNSAYYYIDDVKVIPGFPQVPPTEAPRVFDDAEPRLNTPYVLKNIQFEFNSYALLPISYVDLDKVITYLLNNTELSVRLSGHTDDVGSKEYNKLLSLNRARSAAAYLISKGIEETRISASGYGESEPLVAEQNEEAREANRRVEIEFHN